MATYNDEQIEQMLRRLSVRSKQTTDRVGCPDEESLAGYLSGSLGTEDRSRLEEHLSACRSCMEEIVGVNQAIRETGTERVPRWLMERAMGLVKPAAKENVVDLVVRLARNTVELVSTAGEWMVPLTLQPVAVRGAASPAKTGILQVEREIAGHKVGVEVEQVESGICQVVVSVATADGKPQDGVRLSLLSGEREQASYLTRQGRAVFEGIAKGDYNLALSKAGARLGTIRLRIEGDV